MESKIKRRKSAISVWAMCALTLTPACVMRMLCKAEALRRKTNWLEWSRISLGPRLLSHRHSWAFFLIFVSFFSFGFRRRSLFIATLTTSEHLCASVSRPTHGSDGISDFDCLFLFLSQSSDRFNCESISISPVLTPHNHPLLLPPLCVLVFIIYGHRPSVARTLVFLIYLRLGLSVCHYYPRVCQLCQPTFLSDPYQGSHPRFPRQLASSHHPILLLSTPACQLTLVSHLTFVRRAYQGFRHHQGFSLHLCVCYRIRS